MQPVLIVGAGPVGLAAAAFLSRLGTAVRIIDSNSSPTPYSKALVLWRRSLLTLDPTIPVEQWLSVGAIGKTAFFGDQGAVIASLDLTNPSGSDPSVAEQEGRVHALPPAILVSQADVEGLLLQALQEKHGVSVERSTSLSAFKVSDDGSTVHCTLVDSQGRSEEMVASFLIGCDGARSSVRKQLGLSFEGSTLTQRWLLADCCYELDERINPNKPKHPIEGQPMRDALFVCTSAAGVVGTIPVAGREGVVRLIWNADSLCPHEPTLVDFQQLLATHTRQQIRLTKAIWISDFKINERQVEQYVHCGGRVLLAGDAAHIHSPAGGQGMNTGLQDAANLAWKVALVAAGEAADSQQLLKTYHEERWPVGADAIRNSGVMLRVNTVRSYFLRLLRSCVLRVLLAVPFIRTNMLSALTEDSIAYPTSSLAAPAATSASIVSTTSAAKAAAAAAAAAGVSGTRRATWGSCKPGTAFPDVSMKVDGIERPATDLLRGGLGCFGSLVLMPGASQQQQQQQHQEGSSSRSSWPTKWGHWKLHVTQVQLQGSTGSDAGVFDAFGLLSAALGGKSDVGVLVRPDGIVAAVGGPEELQAWLSKHVARAGGA